MKHFFTTPAFWSKKNSFLSVLLSPLSLIVSMIGRWRQRNTKAHRVSVPVICVGNVTLGGTGKTPLVMSLAYLLRQQGFTPHILSRGYGAKVQNPIQVLPSHLACHVGDEPLLLAKAAPTWVYPDRIKTAKLAIENGADILLLDDGLQNSKLHKDISLLVVEGVSGFGNGRVFPAGPLREPVRDAMQRVDAIILYGEMDDLAWTKDKPVFRVALNSDQKPTALSYLAFAGIGRPQKFFDSLVRNNFVVKKTCSFPDHHVYREREIEQLVKQAQENGVKIITTAKDAVKIPLSFRSMIEVFNVDCIFSDPDSFQKWFLAKVKINF